MRKIFMDRFLARTKGQQLHKQDAFAKQDGPAPGHRADHKCQDRQHKLLAFDDTSQLPKQLVGFEKLFGHIGLPAGTGETGSCHMITRCCE